MIAGMDPGLEKLTELVLTTGAQKALELGYDKLRSVLTRVKTELSTPQYEIDKAISDHQAEVRAWAADVSFTETPLGRRLSPCLNWRIPCWYGSGPRSRSFFGLFFVFGA